MNVNELLQQSGISHAVYLERYKTSEVRSLIELLNTADKDLVAEIAKRSGDSITKQRLKALLRDVRRINSEAMAELGKSLGKDMEELAVYESSFQAKKVTEYIPIEWNITQPAPATLRAAILDRPFESGLLSQHVTNIEGRKLQQVEGAIRTGLVEGESIDQITRRIRGTRAQQYADGILEASRREVEALVRTAVNHTVSTAREVLYQQNPDLIKGIQYIATLDSRTTLICASLDGKVFAMNEGPRPPQHWRCRSTTIPVLKSWRELGIDMDEVPASTRASMNGQVPAKTTFPEWLKGQPEKVQIEVLGQKRWELWKNGAPLEKFVSDGRVLSLQELAELEGLAVPTKPRKSLVKTVPKFKNHREASAWAVDNNVAQYSSFKGVDPAIARDWIQGAIDTKARVPGLKMDFIGTAQERNRYVKDMMRPKAEEWASRFYEPGTKSHARMVSRYLRKLVPPMRPRDVAVSFGGPGLSGVGINAKFGKRIEDFTDMVRRNMESGWWSRSDKPTVAHIISHEMGHEIDRLFDLRKDRRLVDLYRSHDVMHELSEYGSRSIAEMIAEGWAEYTGSSKPRPLATQIGKIIEEAISESERFGKTTSA